MLNVALLFSSLSKHWMEHFMARLSSFCSKLKILRYTKFERLRTLKLQSQKNVSFCISGCAYISARLTAVLLLKLDVLRYIKTSMAVSHVLVQQAQRMNIPFYVLLAVQDRSRFLTYLPTTTTNNTQSALCLFFPPHHLALLSRTSTTCSMFPLCTVSKEYNANYNGGAGCQSYRGP